MKLPLAAPLLALVAALGLVLFAGRAQAQAVGSARPGGASAEADATLFSAVLRAFLPLVSASSTAGRQLLINPRPVKPSGLLGDPFVEVEPATVRARAQVADSLGIATILDSPEPACRRGGGRMLANPDSASLYGPMRYCVLLGVPRPIATDRWVTRVYGVSSGETVIYDFVAERDATGAWRVVEQRMLQHFVV